MDPIITAAIATAVSGFSLFLAKYIITCLCPGRIECHPKLGCNKPNDLNPIVTLKSLWEEQFIHEENEIKHEIIGKNKFVYAKQNKKNNTWEVEIKNCYTVIHLYRENDPKPTSGNHYIYTKIRAISGFPEINLFVKRFTGDANCWEFAKKKPPKIEEPVVFHETCCNEYVGESELYIRSLIDVADVTKEQVGMTIKGECKVIIDEVYYSDNLINIISCPKCCYSFYKCKKNCEPISDGENIV